MDKVTDRPERTNVAMPTPLVKRLRYWCLDNDTSVTQLMQKLAEEHLASAGEKPKKGKR